MKEYKNIKYYITDDYPCKGVKFIDFTPSLLDYQNIEKIIDELVELVKEDVDYIVVPDARGFIWGMGVANKLKVGLIPVRKTGKLPKENIQNSINYKTEYSTTSLDLPIVDLNQKKCLFVDDVYATGGTYKAVKEMVEKSGGIVTQAIVLYNVLIENNKEIYYLYDKNDLIK